MRIRGFTQDDSHIYCTEEQLADEIASLLDFVHEGAARVRLRRLHVQPVDEGPEEVRRHRRDLGRGHRRAARGAREVRPRVQDQGGRRRLLRPEDRHRRQGRHRPDAGSCRTIQCDFNLPERFELEYVGADNARHRPIMLHRALFGSVERFFGVLVEHYAGAFPTWLAPLQAACCRWPTAHEGYAAEVVGAAAGRRRSGPSWSRPTTSSASASAVRRSEKMPYVLVVGDDDVAAGTVGVNPRGGEVERGVPLDEFVAPLHRRGPWSSSHRRPHGVIRPRSSVAAPVLGRCATSSPRTRRAVGCASASVTQRCRRARARSRVSAPAKLPDARLVRRDRRSVTVTRRPPYVLLIA